jgi:hypothetical protein
LSAPRHPALRAKTSATWNFQTGSEPDRGHRPSSSPLHFPAPTPSPSREQPPRGRRRCPLISCFRVASRHRRLGKKQPTFDKGRIASCGSPVSKMFSGWAKACPPTCQLRCL